MCDAGRYITLHICQNPQTFTAQIVKFNVCKLEKKFGGEGSQDVTETVTEDSKYNTNAGRDLTKGSGEGTGVSNAGNEWSLLNERWKELPIALHSS